MDAIIYQYDEPPLTLRDVETPIDIEGDDITLVNYEGRISVNIDDVQEIRLIKGGH